MEVEKSRGNSRHEVERQEDDEHIPEELGCAQHTKQRSDLRMNKSLGAAHVLSEQCSAQIAQSKCLELQVKKGPLPAVWSKPSMK